MLSLRQPVATTTLIRKMDSIIISTPRIPRFNCRHDADPANDPFRSLSIPGWTRNVLRKDDPQLGISCTTVFLHERTGIRVSRTNDMHTRVEVSLPRLLFGHNSQLIVSQAQIDAALAKLWPILDEVLVGTDDPGGKYADWPNAGYPYTFNGIHFAWHLAVSPDRLIRILCNSKHPEIHRKTTTFDTSIRFPGTGMVISVYDKIAELTRNRDRSQSWTRVEVQWKNPDKLKIVLGVKPVEHLDFHQLYTAYRNTLLRFDCPQISTSSLAYSKPGAIAWMLANGLSAPGGGDPVQWAFDNKVPATRGEKEAQRRFRRQVEHIAVGLERFSFADHLPEDGPSVDVPGCDDMVIPGENEGVPA